MERFQGCNTDRARLLQSRDTRVREDNINRPLGHGIRQEAPSPRRRRHPVRHLALRRGQGLQSRNPQIHPSRTLRPRAPQPSGQQPVCVSAPDIAGPGCLPKQDRTDRHPRHGRRGGRSET